MPLLLTGWLFGSLVCRDCSTMMVELHRGAARGKLTGVHRKYSTFKYGCAAKSEPAAFLLDARRA